MELFLFDSGQTTLRPQSKAALEKIADILKTSAAGEIVRIEGHTDNDPVLKQKDKYKSNWELSAALAADNSQFDLYLSFCFRTGSLSVWPSILTISPAADVFSISAIFSSAALDWGRNVVCPESNRNSSILYSDGSPCAF